MHNFIIPLLPFGGYFHVRPPILSSICQRSSLHTHHPEVGTRLHSDQAVGISPLLMIKQKDLLQSLVLITRIEGTGRKEQWGSVEMSQGFQAYSCNYIN